MQRNLRRVRNALLWARHETGMSTPPPVSAQIEITNRCNLACRTCTRLKLPVLGDMPLATFRTILAEIGPVRTLWLSGQGEPLLHPEIGAMVRLCVEEGVAETIIHTNGMLLTGKVADDLAESGLTELRISIDGATAEEMEYLREGASLTTVIDQAREFAARGGVLTSFYFVLNRRNHESAHLMPGIAAACGIGRIHFVEMVPFRDESTEREIFDRREYQFASLPMPVRKETLARIRDESLRHCVEARIDLKWHRKRCFAPFNAIYIDFRGNVTPCCRIHNEVFVGNIVRDGLEGSWNGESMARWRADLLRPARHRRICVERCNLGIGAGRRTD